MNFAKAVYDSPLGELQAEAVGNFLIKLKPLKGEKQDINRDAPVFSIIFHWLDAYFDGHNPSIANLPLKPQGSQFRQSIWSRLLQIAYGKYVTYGQIAKEQAEIRHMPKMASQAIGGAVGANPIFIIIPCHRVVGANYQLRGYGGGVQMKMALLMHEGVDISPFNWSKIKK